MSKYVSPFAGATRIKSEKKKEKYVSPFGAVKKKTDPLTAAGYIVGKAGLGVGGVVEGVADLAMAGIDITSRGDTRMAEKRFLNSVTREAEQALTEKVQPGAVLKFVGDAASGVGQSSVFLLDSVVPGLGTGLFFAGVGSQGISSAAQQTGEVGAKEIGYGVASGATEAILEKLLGAGGQAAGKLASGLAKKGVGMAAQKGLSTTLTRAAGKSLGKTLLLDTAKAAGGEFAEEFSAEYIDAGIQRLFGIDPNASTSFKEALYAGAVGAVSGGVMGAPASLYNYRSSVEAGRAIRTEGGVDSLLSRAKATVGVLRAQEVELREKAKTKAPVAEGAEKATKKAAVSQWLSNRESASQATKTKEYAEKLEKNVAAYEGLADIIRNSEAGDALLGELRGNLYLTNYAYAVEEIEEALLTMTDEQTAEAVSLINEEAAKAGWEKTDYTVEDFRNNVDGIRTQFAALGISEQIVKGAWTEEDEQAARAEKVTAQEENAATEDLSGIEEEVWRAVTDETVKGYGTQNAQEVALLRAAVSQNVPEKSIPLMLERFREGTDMTPAEFADAWADGVLLFGRLGLNEEKISQESALSRMSEKARHASIEYGKWLSEEQRSREQEAAKKKKRPVKEGESRKPKGEVVRHPGINLKADLDDAQFTAYKAAEIMAPALKADIEIHKGLERKGKQVNGYYDKKTNTIHINIDAVRDGKHIALYTLGHEVAHYIKAWSPKKFYELGDYVMEQLEEGAEQAIRDKLDFLKRNGLVDGLDETEAYDRAYEEVVADGMELVLTDGTVLDALARENKTLWQKIKDRIFEIIEKIKKAYGDLSKTSRTAQILSETMDSLDEIEQLFYEGVTEAGERTRTAGVETVTRMNEEKMHVSEKKMSIRSEYPQEIEEWHRDGRPEGESFVLGMTGDVLQGLGAIESDIYINGDKIKEILKEHPEMTLEEIKKIPQILEDPVLILKSRNVGRGGQMNSRMVIFGAVKAENGQPVMSVLDLHPTENNFTISDMQKVTSAYTKTTSPVQFVKDSFIVYADKKRTASLLRSIGFQMPIELNKSGYIGSISYKGRSVNIFGEKFSDVFVEGQRKYSIEETDDTAYLAAVERGDMETVQRMVDEAAKKAGYTEEVFHGMGGRYNTYKSGNGQYGAGVYFTVDKGIARGYGKVVDHLYVKVGKIADYDDAYKVLGKTEDQTLDEFAQSLGFPDFDEMINDWDNDPTDVASNPELIDLLKNKGFEGFVDDGNAGFVLWDFDGISYRIKSADPVTYDNNGNVIPLSERFKEDNPDIRYSIDETPETPDVSENPFVAAVRRMEEAEAERDVDERTRRRMVEDHLLIAEGLMQTVRNEEEYRTIKKYRAKAEELADAELRVAELRKKTAETNRQLDALNERIKGVPKGQREPWVLTELDEVKARKKAYMDEMDELNAKLEKEIKRLLSGEAARPLRRMMAEVRKKANAEVRRAQRAQEKAEKTTEEIREKYRAEEKYKSDRREMSVRERVARRVVGRMNTMFYNPTKTKHVPADLQALVEAVLKSEKLDTFKETRKNLRQMAEMESEIEKLEQNPARTAKEQETLDKLHYKYAMFEDEGMDAKSQAVALYTAFKEWMERRPPALQDKALLEQMSADIDAMQDMPLSVMSMKSLEAVEDFYKEIYHQVNTANQAFATEKAANIDEMSTEANTQVKEAKELKFLSPRSREWAALAGFRSFFWKNIKPLTVFEAIGSNKLMEIFRRVLDGEDVWITDILEAKKALDEAKKEFGYNSWNLQERREVTTADGSKVSLTLGEMMSLYAYMFREQAEQHLSVGGFVFAPNAKAIESFKGDKGKYSTHLNDQTTHRMRKEDIAKMSEMLTEEQRAYAETVQEYLTSLGEKGNKVSRKLYGIDLFKETAYFPIKSSHDYIETQTGKSGDPNIKSRGTFKETVPKAGNPIVLQDFMEVVGDHVNTMAIYHAFVLPVEDLTRVWNYTPVNIKRDADGKAILDENGMPVADTEGEAGYNSLKAEITKKYGKEANDYILQLLRDLNGGARRESAASILDKGLTAFKRSATMLSLSTIVQQPTSILRAMAYVDAKHFTGASFVPWETVKKYAPVAAIKEIGGHDTSTGARTADYINSKEYENQKDKLKAAALGILPESYGGDKQARDEYFGWLTYKADEVSWRYMFGAIVNEQAEKLGKPKDSEEVLKAAGERFAEVVRRTQVYDSTLTRSEYMRSKDGLMKMATAFGAEPTTVVSMVADAIIKAERGDKTFLRKSAAGIAFSVIANAAVASLIYAMRDDDEDETIPEKYVQSLTSELIEGFNPLEYLPIARDIMSMFKGYEIERSDMALVGNLMEQVELITSSKRSVPDKIFGVTGAVSAFFGLPVTNVYRDFKGLVKTGQSFTDAEEQTGAGLGHAMGDAVRGQFNLFSKLFGAESGNAYELYTAYVSGDTAHYERVKARYKTPQAAEMALRQALRDHEPRISEAAEARLSGDLAVYESIVDQIESEGIFDRNIVIRAINNEMLDLKDEDTSKLVPKDETVTDEEETAESLYKASDLNNALERGDTEDFAVILAALVEDKVSTGKTEAQARASVKSSITAYWKKLYIEAWSRDDTEERKRIIAILTETGLYGTRNDVATLAQNWVKNSK